MSDDFIETARRAARRQSLDDLKRQYLRWQKRRERIADDEANGEWVSAGRWENSDDDGIDILRSVAAALGWETDNNEKGE